MNEYLERKLVLKFISLTQNARHGKNFIHFISEKDFLGIKTEQKKSNRILHVFKYFIGTEEDVVKSKKTFRSQAVVNQNAETELMLEGDDDAVSLLQEKEIDNLAGKNSYFWYAFFT